jgi:protein involved in polysaccharide export with SLBB domain
MKNSPRLSLVSSASSALLLSMVLGLSSCSLPENDNTFDLYDDSATATGERIHFYDVPLRNSLAPQDLRPSRDEFLIGPGDLLEIDIVEVPYTKAVTTVLPDGTLYYDIAGPVIAAGKSIEQLERDLADALEKQYSFPIVNINLKEVKSRNFTILGQVKRQGTYEMSQPTTVLDAVSRAGGTYTAFSNGKTQELADLGRSILVRSNRIVPIDFEALIEKGDMSQNAYLQPGDYLYLPASGTERVFVLGAVRFPASVGWSSKLTLASALATARGPAPNAYVSGALLIRGSVARPQVARVDLASVIKGREPNFHLQPGDILWVPKAPWQKLQEYAVVAVNAAVTTVAVRETARIFGEDATSVTPTAGTASSGSPSTSATQELTISTGPEIASSAEAISSPAASVATGPEPLLSDTMLSNAFGN